MSDMLVSAAARQEAAAVYRCPVIRTGDGLAILEEHGGVADKEWLELGAELKPETYGLLGRLIERTVEPVVARVEQALPLGSLGLFVYPVKEDEKLREATPSDVNDWTSLRELWKENIAANIVPAIVGYEDQDEITALRALIKFRWLGIVSLEEIMAEGAGTGAGGCVVMQSGIENHLVDLAKTHRGKMNIDLSNGDTRANIVMRSYGPLVEAANLNPLQLMGFGEAHAVKITSGEPQVVTSPDGTESQIFELGKQARVNLNGPIENFPNKGGNGVIGDIDSALPGQRTGCPILLSPKLTQRLWVASAGTAKHTGLLGANLRPSWPKRILSWLLPRR